LRIQLQTAYNSMAARTEIVHIYPGMETRGDYAFTQADFGVPVEISGTVDLSGLGTVSGAEMRVYRYEDFTSQEGYFYESNPSGTTWAWTVRTLPFNEPTDLYVELEVGISGGGGLTKRLSVPVSVYNQNVTVPAMGPFTVNRFELSGVVDFSDLTSLGISYTNAWVSVYHVYQNGSIPARLGGFVVGGNDSWHMSLLTEESSLPVLLVLEVQTSNSMRINEEIRTTVSGNRSDLNFKPGTISAGTKGGVTLTSGHRYLFVPASTGVYALKVSVTDTQPPNLYLYDASGNQLGFSYSNPAMLSCSLSAGTVYYIDMRFGRPGRTFELQVNPINQVTLGGTVSFNGILSPFSGVTVSSANIAVYSDDSYHASLGTGTITLPGGSWSVTAGLDGSSVPAVFVITANLSNGHIVNHQESRTLTGSNNSLSFSPAVVTGENPVDRTISQQYDYLLYVPATAGDYSLGTSAGADRYLSLLLYDAQTGNQLTSAYGYGDLEMVRTLDAGKPYLIRVDYSGSSSATVYQFQARKLLHPVTLSGTVDLSGLAPHLTSADINYTRIQVYTGASGPAPLGSSVMAANNGSWSATIPTSGGTRAVRIEASVYLKNTSLRIIAQRQDTISGDTTGLDLAPAAVPLAGGQGLSRVSGYGGDWFLFVPSATGLFNMAASSGSGTPWLALYDTAGAQVGQSNTGSLYAKLTTGTPYIVQVYNSIQSFTAYQFQLSAAITTPTTLGGTVNFSGLSSWTTSSAKILIYPNNYNILETGTVNLPGDTWSITSRLILLNAIV
jgi:hypothetical protein